ncbi:MAG: MOSC N-terminal beta barrel domain-containing protein [bacterium]|nr:MOSC N-terminal beta barrel domain-containing protein [bacterium]
MTTLTITSLHTYPIKSCGGLAHDTAALDGRGLRYDRQWMVVRDDDSKRGAFVTQREYPRLALIQPHIKGEQMRITAPNMPELCVPLVQERPADMAVTVWRDTVNAVDQGDAAAAWVSAFLGGSLRLVRFGDEVERGVNVEWAKTPAQTGFADGYPLLLAHDASLHDLNARLAARGKAPVPMSRFRPNIVVSGGAAWAEDDWEWLEVAGIRLQVVKPCARCAITTVDQATGVAPDRAEPLATLETFRRMTGAVNGVIFGQNVVHRGMGALHLHDSITIIG